MTTLLISIIAAPLVALFALWYSSKLVSTPWQTTAEALVRLLYWLALRLQGTAEAVDSGLVCYRDAIARPTTPSCEVMRQLREINQQTARENQGCIERTKQGISEWRQS